jgi:two-component system OmpR family response regulator
MPDGCDLRQLGWTMLDPRSEPLPGEAPPLLAMPHRAAVADWVMLLGASPRHRRRVLAIGVDDAGERARLLRLGFGDAVPGPPQLEEVESRAMRIAAGLRTLPRQRQIGPLQLDLLQREAFVSGRAVGLHPREFLLLWRLADDPGRAVAASQLRGDVWRLAFRPETNSLAVHVSRLRAKLRIAGLDGLIQTLPGGAYRLAGELLRPGLALPADLGLDAHLRLGKEAREHQSGIEDQCGTN